MFISANGNSPSITKKNHQLIEKDFYILAISLTKIEVVFPQNIEFFLKIMIKIAYNF